MEEKTKITSSDGTSSLKLPSTSVTVPAVVPFIRIFTPGSVRDRFLKNRFDAEFHSTLHRISRNHTILRFLHMLYTLFKVVLSRHINSKAEVTKVDTQRDLLNELKGDKTSGFREKMSIHPKVYLDKVD